MVKHGPFGSKKAGQTTSWSTDFDEDSRITKVIIWYGYIVDGIGFEIADSKGNKSVQNFTGGGGDVSEIELDSDEYITQISGTYGEYKFSEDTLVTSLSIHTNKRPRGCGPYGGAIEVNRNTPFITTHLENYAIVGFSGCYKKYLHSIAAYSRRITPQ